MCAAVKTRNAYPRPMGLDVVRMERHAATRYRAATRAVDIQIATELVVSQVQNARVRAAYSTAQAQ